MASEFIGYNVSVTLRAPPNASVQGVVANVIGQRLMLRDGMCFCLDQTEGYRSNCGSQ